MAEKQRKFLEQEIVDKILADINNKITYNEIREKYNVSYHVYYRIKHGYSYNSISKHKPGSVNESFKENLGRENYTLARKYWNTFLVGDDVSLCVSAEGKLKAHKLSGEIMFISQNHMRITKNQRNIQIHFSDLVTKHVKIKKYSILEE